jgi:hypothetical protein
LLLGPHLRCGQSLELGVMPYELFFSPRLRLGQAG